MPLNNHANKSTDHTVVSSTVKRRRVEDGEMVIDGLDEFKKLGAMMSPALFDH